MPTKPNTSRLHLTAFMEVGTAIVSSLEFNEVVQRILDTTRRLIAANVVTLRLLHAETETLRLVGVAGMDGEFPSEYYTVKVGESCVGRALAERRPYPVSDLKDSPFKFRDLAHARSLRSLIAIPVEFRERLLGGLTAYWDKPRVHAAETIHLMTAIGTQAAVAIQNADQYADSIHSLFALARAIEAKDAYTMGHSERVTRFAVLLAGELRLPPRETNLLRQMCPLHDVGKVGVSERVLQKSGSLTPEERAEMATHTVIGWNIVKPIRIFADGLPIVRSHHERLDGTGYPDRLRGEEIPLLARVAAVADAFDAMTSRRPYREALTPDAAIAEIERCSGTQFDPVIAHAMVRMVRGRDARVLEAVAR